MSTDRRAEIEAWWALIARVLSFFLGGLLLTYEALFGQADNSQVRTVLIVAGVAMIGPVVAASAASIMAAIRGRSQ
jgi:hypothetical protein